MKRVENTKISYELDQQIGKFHTHTEGRKKRNISSELEEEDGDLHEHTQERKRERNEYIQANQRAKAKRLCQNIILKIT